MMSEDEVCPDFNIGLSEVDEQDTGRFKPDKVQSDSLSETDQSVSAQLADEPGQAKSLSKLRQLLVMPGNPSPSDSQGRRSRRRRLSRSRSMAVRRVAARKKKTE